MHCLICAALAMSFATSRPEVRRSLEYEARGRTLLSAADAAFERADYAAAEAGYREVLQGRTLSRLAPPALFKLASVLQLNKKPDEAKSIYEQLVRDHFDSTWTKVVLQTAYSESQLFELAEERRESGLDKDRQQDLEAATELFELYVQRFPKDRPNKVTWNQCEILYKTGRLASARELNREDKWSKLSDIVLGGPDDLPKNIDRLMGLAEQESEARHALVRLSNDFKGKEADKVAYCRGRCFEALEKTAEARKIYDQFEELFPRSKWRAPAALRKAELSFSRKAITDAKLSYTQIVQNFPATESATLASKRLKAIDEVDSSWLSAQEIMEGLIDKVGLGRTGIAFTFEGKAGKDQKPVRGRFAYENQFLYFDLQFRQERFLLALNGQGSCYQFGAQQPIRKSTERIDLPVASINMTGNSEHGILTYALNTARSGTPSNGLVVKIAPEALRGQIARLRTAWHLERTITQTATKTEGFLYRFEQIPWFDEKPTCVEVETNLDRTIRSIRLTRFDSGHLDVWNFTDVQLGERLAQEKFAVSLPLNSHVQDDSNPNILEIFSQLSHTLGVMWNEDVMGKPKPAARRAQAMKVPSVRVP
ncbi:hypothetical protein BH10PLA2_BH10PLA2_23870 [soil metagenome]